MDSMKTFLNDINYLVVLLAWTQNTWQLLVHVQDTWRTHDSFWCMSRSHEWHMKQDFLVYCTSHINKLTSYYSVYGKDKF